MAKLPRKLSGKQLLRVFRKLGFVVVRQRSSHVFIEHQDGRHLTIPMYDVVPVNLLNWILAEAQVTREEFLRLLQ